MDKMELFAELSKTACECCIGKTMCDYREKYASSCRKIHEIAACVEPIITALEKQIEKLKDEVEMAWSASAVKGLRAKAGEKRAYRAQMALSIANEYLNGKFAIDKSKLPTTTSGELDWYNAFMLLAQKTEEV